MHINDYKEIVGITSIFPESVNDFGITYAFLGLIDELCEFEEALEVEDDDNFIKEAGDVFWYVTALCDKVWINVEDIFSNYHFSEDFITPLLRFSGNIKKYYRDGESIDKEKLSDILKSVVGGVVSTINPLSNIHIDKILEVNYNKLIKRKNEGKIQGDGDNR